MDEKVFTAYFGPVDNQQEVWHGVILEAPKDDKVDPGCIAKSVISRKNFYCNSKDKLIEEIKQYWSLSGKGELTFLRSGN